MENLLRQGYECFLPTYLSEKLRHGRLKVAREALFPRYLFIQLGQDVSAKSWTPIRSTKGVSRLVSFGLEPAKVDDGLIAGLKEQEIAMQATPDRLFEPGERVLLTESPFSGLEGIYQMPDGERRVMVLLELLSKPVAVQVSAAAVRKIE